MARAIVGKSRQVLGRTPRLLTKVVTLVDVIGNRVDWSAATNLIAHGREVTGSARLYTMDGNGGTVNALYLTATGDPLLHSDQPAWHPSGSHIIFQSKDAALLWPGDPADEAYATQAGAGFHNNLWAYTVATGVFTKLTSVIAGEAILHPHFNNAGTNLTYARGYPVIGWSIKVATWNAGPPPSITVAATYRPNAVTNDTTFFETHGFTPADDHIIYTDSAGRASAHDLDISKMHFPSGATTYKLTDSPGVWDEHAIVSPLGNTIVWASSQGYTYDLDDWGNTLRLDYWLMDINGNNKRRLTYFNEPGYLEYTGKRTIVADCSWSADGRSIVAVASIVGLGTRIVRIDLPEAY